MIRQRPLQPEQRRQAFHSYDEEATENVKLTPREKEVLQWSLLGKSSWDIARIVGCTEAGVNFHFYNLRRKFGVSSRHTAALKAVQLGLITFS